MLTASSSTALANLAYLIGAVVVAVIGGLIVWMRHRQPKSVDANMASFRRGLNALAPDGRASSPAHPRPEQFRVRPKSTGVRVRPDSEHLESDEAAPEESGPEDAAPQEAPASLPGDETPDDVPAGERTGGQGG